MTKPVNERVPVLSLPHSLLGSLMVGWMGGMSAKKSSGCCDDDDDDDDDDDGMLVFFLSFFLSSSAWQGSLTNFQREDRSVGRSVSCSFDANRSPQHTDRVESV